MKIGNAEDAKSVVRKYFLGTRTFHGKITSFIMQEKIEGPGDDGSWQVKGTYVTEAGVRQDFTATVSPRGEVTTNNSTKPKSSWR